MSILQIEQVASEQTSGQYQETEPRSGSQQRERERERVNTAGSLIAFLKEFKISGEFDRGGTKKLCSDLAQPMV